MAVAERRTFNAVIASIFRRRRALEGYRGDVVVIIARRGAPLSLFQKIDRFCRVRIALFARVDAFAAFAGKGRVLPFCGRRPEKCAVANLMVYNSNII